MLNDPSKPQNQRCVDLGLRGLRLRRPFIRYSWASVARLCRAAGAPKPNWESSLRRHFLFAVEMLGEGFKVWDVGAWVWDVTFSFGLRAFGLHSDFLIFGGFGSLSERCQGLRIKGT